MRRLASATAAAVSLVFLTACSAGGGGAAGGGGSAGGGGQAPTCTAQHATFVDTMKSSYPDSPAPPATVDISSLSLPKGVSLPKPDCAWQDKITGADVAGELWEAGAYYRSGNTKVIDGLKTQLKAAGCVDKTADDLGEWICNVDTDGSNPAYWEFQYDLSGESYVQVDIQWEKD